MKPYYHWFLAFSFSNRSRSHLWQKSGSFSHPTQLDEIFSQLGEEDGRVWVQIDRDFVGWHDDRHSVAVLLKSPNQVVKKMQIFVEGLESRNQHLSLSFTKLQRPIIILALMGHDFWLFKMRSLEVKLKSFVKHLYLFWLKNVIARWYLKGRWIFFINQTGTWLLRTCLVASCDVMTMSRTQNRFLGWVVSLEADSPHVFAEIFRLIMDQCSHGRTPIKTMGSDKRISKFNIVQDGCFDLNLLQLLTKKRFPIYNKTLQCFKNACFPKNFPVSSLRAHGGASFCWDSFLSLDWTMKLKYCLLYLTSSFTGFFLQDLVGDTTQACDGNGWEKEIGLKVCQVVGCLKMMEWYEKGRYCKWRLGRFLHNL